VQENNHKGFDNTFPVSYNDSNDGVIRIDKRSLRPLHDPKCEHEYKLDPDDADNVMFDVYKCVKPGCVLGFLAQKSGSPSPEA
jgi:hypothetical protein